MFVSGRRVYVCTYGIWSACVCKLKEARQAASASRVDAGDVAYRPHERTFVANRARHAARVDHSLPTRYVRPHCPQVTAAFHLRALGASAGPAAAGHCCCWLSCAVDVCMHGEPGSCLRCGRRARACRGAYVAGAAHVHETFRPWPRARTKTRHHRLSMSARRMRHWRRCATHRVGRGGSGRGGRGLAGTTGHM